MLFLPGSALCEAERHICMGRSGTNDDVQLLPIRLTNLVKEAL